MPTSTHLVKVWYYITEEGQTKEHIRKDLVKKWGLVLGDSLENIEVIEE